MYKEQIGMKLIVFFEVYVFILLLYIFISFIDVKYVLWYIFCLIVQVLFLMVVDFWDNEKNYYNYGFNICFFLKFCGYYIQVCRFGN